MSYYSVLDVPAGAPLEAIKAAYRRKLLQVHPDKQRCSANSDTNNASSDLIRIQEAYDILKDPQARAVYDSRLRSEQLRSRFEGIPWMTIKVSDMDLVEDSHGHSLYEYDCRCGGVFELRMELLHELARGPVQLTCLHCSSGLQIDSQF